MEKPELPQKSAWLTGPPQLNLIGRNRTSGQHSSLPHIQAEIILLGLGLQALAEVCFGHQFC